VAVGRDNRDGHALRGGRALKKNVKGAGADDAHRYEGGEQERRR